MSYYNHYELIERCEKCRQMPKPRCGCRIEVQVTRQLTIVVKTQWHYTDDSMTRLKNTAVVRDVTIRLLEDLGLNRVPYGTDGRIWFGATRLASTRALQLCGAHTNFDDFLRVLLEELELIQAAIGDAEPRP